ncbi:MAG: hypothetical protein J0H14_23680 [Alphaproteobacteria bacterium]|nr:hypothetical protein [Alphaproteobacteria bacterium]
MSSGNHNRTREESVSDVAFDRWLRDSLRREYAAIQHEPVPDALLRLLEEYPAAPARGPCPARQGRRC